MNWNEYGINPILMLSSAVDCVRDIQKDIVTIVYSIVSLRIKAVT
jgi:hypothetical protein